jgi:hypothetical protein
VEKPDPAAFTIETKQHLSHGKTDQFTVSQLRSTPTTDTRWNHMVIDEHIECCQEGVQFFAHTLILDTLLPRPEPGPLHMIFTESII